MNSKTIFAVSKGKMAAKAGFWMVGRGRFRALG
jgi:hypothetical protein